MTHCDADMIADLILYGDLEEVPIPAKHHDAWESLDVEQRTRILAAHAVQLYARGELPRAVWTGPVARARWTVGDVAFALVLLEAALWCAVVVVELLGV